MNADLNCIKAVMKGLYLLNIPEKYFKAQYIPLRADYWDYERQFKLRRSDTYVDIRHISIRGGINAVLREWNNIIRANIPQYFNNRGEIASHYYLLEEIISPSISQCPPHRELVMVYKQLNADTIYCVVHRVEDPEYVGETHDIVYDFGGFDFTQGSYPERSEPLMTTKRSGY